MCAGQNPMEVSAVVKGEARIFSFVVHERDRGTVDQLNLPHGSRVIFMYRNEHLILPDADSRLQKGDEVVIISHSKVLAELEARWGPKAEGQDE
jgi:trk system potassium uptake protein TrkA